MEINYRGFKTLKVTASWFQEDNLSVKKERLFKKPSNFWYFASIFFFFCFSFYVCSAHVREFWLVEKSRLSESALCRELEWDAPSTYHGSMPLLQTSLFAALLYYLFFAFLMKHCPIITSYEESNRKFPWPIFLSC